MSSSQIPALQGNNLKAIYGYLEASAAAIENAASDEQIGDLQARAQRVDAIFHSVTDTIAQGPVFYVQTGAEASVQKKLSSKSLDHVATQLSKGQKNPTYADLKERITAAHAAAHEMLAALQTSLVLAASPSPSPRPDQQEETTAAAAELTLDSAPFGTFPQFDLSQLNLLTGPFTFGAPSPTDKPAAARASTPVVEQHDEEASAAPTEQGITSVPTLNLAALLAATHGQLPDDVRVPGTPHSAAPSDDDSESGDDLPLVSARSTAESEDGKQTAETEDHHVAATEEEEAASGDELEEDEEITERPVDTVIATGTKGYSCRPGRKSACAAVGLVFTGALVQLRETIGTAVTTHGPNLWNGIQTFASQKSGQAVALAAQLWESAPKREQVVQIVAESTVGQALVNEDDVSPAVPGLKVKHVAQAGLAASVLTFVGIGYCLSRKSKEKAE